MLRTGPMIASFRDAATEELWRTGRSKRIAPGIHSVALRKLTYLDSAAELSDLRMPPGNRLEALKGDREGQHSIRVNDQYRLCFVRRANDAYDVELVDYH